MRPAWPGGCCTCSAPGCWSWPTAASTATPSSPRCTPPARRCCAGRSPPGPRWAPSTCPTAPTCPAWMAWTCGSSRPGVVMTGADGSRIACSYRLITTLADHRAYPADSLVRLYHERWEIESAYLALRHTLLDGRVLRSGDRPGIEQELWALLTVYQLLRMAMVTAVETRPGTNPGRASFTTALESAVTSSPPPRGSARKARPTWPASSAAPSWPPCCPPAVPASAPARSNAPPPATSTTATSDPTPSPRSPRSASPSAPRHSMPPPPGPASAGPTAEHPPATDRAPDPAAADHRHHHQPAATRLGRTRTRGPAPRQAPPHAHPARRMEPAWLLHPHRLRHLPAQHAAGQHMLDNRARPLTTRHCVARDRTSSGH